MDFVTGRKISIFWESASLCGKTVAKLTVSMAKLTAYMGKLTVFYEQRQHPVTASMGVLARVLAQSDFFQSCFYFQSDFTGLLFTSRMTLPA